MDSESLNIPGLPIVVFRLSSDVKKKRTGLTLPDISDVLHTVKISVSSKYSSSMADSVLSLYPGFTVSGWGLNGDDIEVMRIVVREDLTTEAMAKILQRLIDASKH